jgi:D-amino-acid dehydrogenase
LRVASSVELVGEDLRIDPDRVAQMKDAVNELFPGACDLRGLDSWAGLRPATPDSIPMIGQASEHVSNAYLNVGHGALGLTLAAGSAARLAGQL